MDKKFWAFLTDPKNFPQPGRRVKVVQTHISWVFLAGSYVYKIKKPVDFGFLDFTTLAKRKFYCREELRLNQRLAPDIYLGVIPIGFDRGRYNWQGRGRVVEYAVKMKRLPSGRMMDVRLTQNKVRPKDIDDIAGILADFHERAETGRDINASGGLEAIRINCRENFDQTREYIGRALSRERFDHIEKYAKRFLAGNKALFQKRIGQGRVRACHGDCYSKNICLTDKVYIYDCIEFNKRFSSADVASEIAFLAMDLDFYGRADLSRRLVRTYQRLAGDRDLNKLMAFFKCYRAYVRGKIEAFSQQLSLARKYFDLAYRYAGGRARPRLLIICGLTGSGKSHLAARLARRHRTPVINSDIIRKQLAGFWPGQKVLVGYGKNIYSPGFTRKTYEMMFQEAANNLGLGQSIILDATFLDRKYLIKARDIAQRYQAGFQVIECRCPEGELKNRFKKRGADPQTVSDGRWEIYLAQKKKYRPMTGIPTKDRLKIDTTKSIKRLRNTILDTRY